MNILEIIIVALTVVFVVTGCMKGFVRRLASLVSLVVSVVLVSVCLPYVTDFLKNSTPVYDMIVKQCREIVESRIVGAPNPGGAANGASGDNMGQSALQYADEYLSGGQSLPDQPDSFMQTELIESLPLPKLFREQLLGNNNSEGYRKLGVSTFQEYIVHFCATVILNVLSFIVALLLVQIALRIVIAALDILSHAPVLSQINRVAGLLLGLLQMLFLLWLFFMVLSAISATETGLNLMSMVQESRFLGYLYDSNLFMRIVLQTAGMLL